MVALITDPGSLARDCGVLCLKGNNTNLLHAVAILAFLVSLSICTIARAQNLSERPIIRKHIGSNDFQKYQRLAVLPFTDAPNAPNSGLIAQGIANTAFATAGFQVIERSNLYNILDEQKLSSSGLVDEKHSIRLGKLLGVNAVVIGEVTQYQTINRRTEPFYEAVYNPCDEACQRDFGNLGWMGGVDLALKVAIERNKPRYVLRPGEQWTESMASLSLRVIDVETGLLFILRQASITKATKIRHSNY